MKTPKKTPAAPSSSLKASASMVQPVVGNLDAADHTAFMLRILLYIVACQDEERIEIDLQCVADLTKDKTMNVILDGGKFIATALPAPIPNGGRVN